MNFLTVLLALAMTSASAVEPLSNSEPAQSQASFEAAIRNSYSTAPSSSSAIAVSSSNATPVDPPAFKP